MFEECAGRDSPGRLAASRVGGTAAIVCSSLARSTATREVGIRLSMIEPHVLHTGSSVSAHNETLTYETGDAPHFIDITDDVADVINRSRMLHGIVVVFSRHTTAAIKLNEWEPELIKDMARFLSEIAPVDRDYCHNNFEVRTVNMNEDECPNAHSHCQHLMLSASESIPVINGIMHLGRWQRIFLIELDRPKAREVTVQTLGL